MLLIRGWANRRRVLPAIRPQTVVLCSQQATGMYTNHKINQDSHWQQSDTQPILISAPQWPNRTYNAPTRLYRVGKKPSGKADLAIYRHTVDAARQCMSESLILRHNLDFSSCDILGSFCKSSHKYANIIYYVTRTSLPCIRCETCHKALICNYCKSSKARAPCLHRMC